MPNKNTCGVDRRALKILFSTYWTATGWRDEKSRSISRADFEYAKCAGFMFDKVRLSHEAIAEQALVSVRRIHRAVVADAFVVSLATRRLELRSALGSFAVLQHFPPHDAPPRRVGCPICGVSNHAGELEDLNVLNFERFKWGGVRHDDPLYAGFDLRLFRGLSHATPTAMEVRVLNGVLDAIEAAPAKTSSTMLGRHLAKVLKSNKAERQQLIGILGLCGVLGTEEHPGYMRRFVPWSARELPARRFVDMAYPACWWERSDGVNQEAVQYWFGHLL